MGKRTTQLNEITTIDNNDILYGVDVDDLTHSPDGTSVKFKKSNLLKEVNSRAGDIESDVSELQGIISGLLDWFYPIGTIYHTTSTDLDTTVKMNAHFGGTWEAYGSGRVLVGKAGSGTFSTAGATMGAETHTLTEAQMPSHEHEVWSYRVASGAKWVQVKTGNNNASDSGIDGGQYLGRAVATGGDGSHNNIQPSIVVFRYRRIA
jgi:hypothetical protein